MTKPELDNMELQTERDARNARQGRVEKSDAGARTHDVSLASRLLSCKEDARTHFSQRAWPDRQDERWRRSAPQLIPFDLLDEPRFYNTFALPEYSGRVNFVSWHDVLKGSHTVPEQNDYMVLIKESLVRGSEKTELLPLINMGNANDGVCEVRGPTEHDTEQRLQKDQQKDQQKNQQNNSPKHTSTDKQGVDETETETITLNLSGKEESDIVSPCYVIDIAARARANIKIVLRNSGFFIPSIYIHVHEAAHCRVLYDQDVSLDSIVMSKLYINIEKEGYFHSTALYSGSFQTADTIYSNVSGEGATVLLDGCYRATNDQLIDIRSYQEHSAPSSYSRTRYHGVVDEQGHSVFRGLIKVNNNALYTDAYLTNKNLLLSEEGRVDSIPCLNIDTNEVKCSHGSTTSKVSPTHLFYLESRGLSTQEARMLLIEGFFNSLLPEYYDKENKSYLERIQEEKEYDS